MTGRPARIDGSATMRGARTVAATAASLALRHAARRRRRRVRIGRSTGTVQGPVSTFDASSPAPPPPLLVSRRGQPRLRGPAAGPVAVRMLAQILQVKQFERHARPPRLRVHPHRVGQHPPFACARASGLRTADARAPCRRARRASPSPAPRAMPVAPYPIQRRRSRPPRATTPGRSGRAPTVASKSLAPSSLPSRSIARGPPCRRPAVSRRDPAGR
jgi:hypothetical protein